MLFMYDNSLLIYIKLNLILNYNHNNTHIHIYINLYIYIYIYIYIEFGHFFVKKCKNQNTNSLKNIMKYKFIPSTLK